MQEEMKSSWLAQFLVLGKTSQGGMEESKYFFEKNL